MAQPILLELPKRDPREELRVRLEQAPVEHAEAVLAGFEVLQGLHERGVLELLRGLLGGADKTLEIVVEAAKEPEAIGVIRNLILLAKLFAGIPPDTLNALIQTVSATVSAAAEREKTHKAPGLLHLAGRLRNEDSRHAMSVALDLFEGLGQTLVKSPGKTI
jgi:uncharacterized protein YjgD (DUF1641 family)